MMKKVLFTIIFAMLFTYSTFASSYIPIYLDGHPIPVSTSPVIEDTTIYVPVRDIFEHLGYVVEWDDEIQGIIGYTDTNKFTLVVGNNTAYINDVYVELNAPPKIINGTTMVELEFISQVTDLESIFHQVAQFIILGEDNPELIHIYENSRVVYEDKNIVIRGEELYSIPGEGEYLGYNKLLGHPFTKYTDLYFKIDGSILSTIYDSTVDGSETVYINIDGKRVPTSRYKAYTLFNLESYNKTGTEIENEYGEVARQWLDGLIENQNLYSLITNYQAYLSGSKFESEYNSYLERKRQEEVKKIEDEKARVQAEEEAKVKAEEEAYKKLYRETYDKSYEELSKDWVTEEELGNLGYSIDWLGDEIYIRTGQGSNKIEYSIFGGPKFRFEIDKEYKGNYKGETVIFKKIEDVEIDFPEAKDDSGKMTIYVAGMVFDREDMINIGIIENENSSSNSENNKVSKPLTSKQYEEKLFEAIDTFYSTWITAEELEYNYDVNSYWAGDTIELSNSNLTYIIEGSPTSKFESGKIYDDGNIKYQYVKTYSIPFPEAKDGSGKMELKINDIVFSIEDLKTMGILD